MRSEGRSDRATTTSIDTSVVSCYIHLPTSMSFIIYNHEHLHVASPYYTMPRKILSLVYLRLWANILCANPNYRLLSSKYNLDESGCCRR